MSQQAYAREHIRSRLGIARRTTLSRDEELDLARKYHAGDEEAGKKLVEGNLPLLFLMAKRYRIRKEHIDDLIGEGTLGLIAALPRFDPERGFRFSTFAGRSVIWYMSNYAQRVVEKNIRAPRSKPYRRVFSGLAKKRNAVEIAVAQETGKSPEHSQDVVYKRLAEMFSMSVAELRKYEQLISSNDTQLDGVGYRWDEKKPFISQSDATPADVLLEEKCKQSLFALMRTAMQEHLDPREQKILHDAYFVDEPRSLAAIGRELGVSRERVRQLRNRSFKKLRDTLEKLIRDFDLEKEFLEVA